MVMCHLFCQIVHVVKGGAVALPRLMQNLQLFDQSKMSVKRVVLSKQSLICPVNQLNL